MRFVWGAASVQGEQLPANEIPKRDSCCICFRHAGGSRLRVADGKTSQGNIGNRLEAVRNAWGNIGNRINCLKDSEFFYSTHCPYGFQCFLVCSVQLPNGFQCFLGCFCHVLFEPRCGLRAEVKKHSGQSVLCRTARDAAQHAAEVFI